MSYEIKGYTQAQTARDNYIPDETPLFHCDTCGTEIYEGDEVYYNGWEECWYCDGCVRRTRAKRKEEY
jgi:hypothetical protein